MARGLTRKITRKQARSYEMTRPNPLGVTAIASINKPKRSLAQRAATERLLRANAKRRRFEAKLTRELASARRKATQPSAAYRQRYARAQALLKGDTSMSMQRRRARRNMTARELGELHDVQMGRTKPRKPPPVLWGSGERKKAKGKAKAAKAAVRKRIAAKFPPVTVRAGKTTMPRSYAYSTKSGKAKKIPLWAILGQPSRKALQKRVSEDPWLAKRVGAATKRRDKAAARLLAHGDFFTPNRRTSRRTVPYQTWSKNTMRARANRYKKGKKLRGAALAKWRRVHGAALARGRRKARKHGGKVHGKTRTPKQRAATAKMLRARHGKFKRRTAWKNPAVTQAAANKRRRRTRKNPAITQAAANKRRRRTRKNPVVTQAAANKRRRRTRRNAGMMYTSNAGMMYTSNAGHRRRRRARRNPDFMAKLIELAKVGAAVTVGIVLHRAASYAISEKLLTKVEVFSTGSLAEYRGLVSGAATAVAGIALLGAVAPSQLPKVGAGIMASLVHSIIIAVAKKASPEVAGYLAAYPDAEGSAVHQLASAGYGAYEVTPGFQGLGEYDYYNQYSGYGAAPQITQAAAGMGEFFMPGAAGYGEYEAVDGYGLGATPYIDEGIAPNLDAAERALTVAEAAAGIGDLPLSSTLNAQQVAAPIMDAPGGSRAGILAGGQGIFG